MKKRYSKEEIDKAATATWTIGDDTFPIESAGIIRQLQADNEKLESERDKYANLFLVESEMAEHTLDQQDMEIDKLKIELAEIKEECSPYVQHYLTNMNVKSELKLEQAKSLLKKLEAK